MAKKSSAQDQSVVVIHISADHPKYRITEGKPNARSAWFTSLLAYDGKPLADWVAHVTATPPSLPQRGKNAGKAQGAKAWIKHFTKKQPVLKLGKE